jgi:hypothetical protein
LELPEWMMISQEGVECFRTSSRTGRIAYLVGHAPTQHEAGDKIFEVLLSSPWKDLLEWRSDILR